MAGIAYYILAHSLVAHHGKESPLAIALGKDFKGIASVILWAGAALLSFVNPWIAIALYVVVAIMWLIPDRRIENVMGEHTDV